MGLVSSVLLRAFLCIINALSYYNTIINVFKKTWKYLLHCIDGRCELERICSSYHTKRYKEFYASMTDSLRLSKQRYLRSLLTEKWPDDLNGSVISVASCKLHDKKTDNLNLVSPQTEFFQPLTMYLSDLFAKNTLLDLVRAATKEAFDSNKVEHINMLRGIWETLGDGPYPGIPSKKWKEIGYQGCDPSSDFRALGLLALRCFHYACVNQCIYESNVGKETKNIMRTTFDRLLSNENIVFALEFIRAMNLTLKLIERDELVEAIHHERFVNAPPINFFFYLVKALFIFHSNIIIELPMFHISDKDYEATFIKNVITRIDQTHIFI